MGHMSFPQVLEHRRVENSKPTASRYCPLWAFPSRFPLTVLNASTRERFPHPYKKCFILLSNQHGISQSTPLGAQHPRWHTAQCLDLIRFVTWDLTILQLIWDLTIPPPLWGLASSFSSPTNVGSHNPPPLGPSILVGTPPSV